MIPLKNVGEFGLIARLTQGLATRPDVVLGIGDDAAALDLGAGYLLLATCDAQVEGRHFLMDVTTPREIGHKALAVNLSDIAAMGGEPLWALVSLIASPELDVEVVESVYAGMRELAARYDVAIVGGNVSSTTGPLTLDITALGRVTRERMITRAGARPGDLLMVTGSMGAGIVGLRAVTSSAATQATLPPGAFTRVKARMTTPEPRVREGMALAATGAVTAMMDLSDGLAGDLRHMCDLSQVGALVEAAALPVDEAAREVADALGDDPIALALTGGDDYELLFSVSPGEVERITDALGVVGGTATIIGAITAAQDGLRVKNPDGSVIPLASHGWDHLAAKTDEPAK